MKSSISFLLVFSIVLFSRLPFLDAGYGNDSDSWRIASSARFIAQSAEYKASRLPGFPIVEITYSLIGNARAFFLNGLTAIISALCAGILFLIAKHYGFRCAVFIAIIFAFIPIVFITSTTTIDYLWALMFILLSWYAGLHTQPILSGFFLGVAVGCRITSGAMALPFAILFFNASDKKKTVLHIGQMWTACIVSALFFFLPVFQSYGKRFFTFFDQGYYPPVIDIFKTAFIDVWGILGVCALLAASIMIVFSRRTQTREIFHRLQAKDLCFLWSVTIFFIIEFLAHPKEPGYLIPIIPVILLLLARYLSYRRFAIIGLVLILSSLFISIDSADRPWSPKESIAAVKVHLGGRTLVVDMLHGPMLNDYLKRLEHMRFIKAVIAAADTISAKSVIVTGAWLPYIVQAQPGALPESEFSDYMLSRRNVRYIYLMNKDLLNRFSAEGCRFYHLSSVDIYNQDRFQIDLKKEGANELAPAYNLTPADPITF